MILEPLVGHSSLGGKRAGAFPRAFPGKAHGDSNVGVRAKLEQILNTGSDLRPLSRGWGIQLVDRTNNIIERFFKRMKYDERRRSGRKILTQDFEQLPPEAALVYNLRCPDYVSIVCGSLDRLPEAFAQIDMKYERETEGAKICADYCSNHNEPRIETASLPTRDRKLIRTDEMQKRIAEAAKSRAPYYGS